MKKSPYSLNRLLKNRLHYISFLLLFVAVLGVARPSGKNSHLPEKIFSAPRHSSWQENRTDVSPSLSQSIQPLIYYPQQHQATMTPVQFTNLKKIADELVEAIREKTSSTTKGVRPESVFPLPANLPPGRLYTKSTFADVYYSVDDPKANLTPLSSTPEMLYPMGTALLVKSGATFRFENAKLLPQIRSYSQLSPLFTQVTGELEGMLAFGDQQEWWNLIQEALERKKRGKFWEYTRYGPPQLMDAKRLGSHVSLAVSDTSPIKIAVCDLYPPGDRSRGLSKRDPKNAYLRLRLLIQGKTTAEFKVPISQALKKITEGKHPGKTMAVATPYTNLTFSPNGKYLAAMLVDGRVFLFDKKLHLAHRIDVDMSGVYKRKKREKGPIYAVSDQELKPAYSTPRISFSKDSQTVIGTNAGKVFVYDIPTKELHSVSFPGTIDTCTFYYENVIAASTETGEIYLAAIDALKRGKLKLRSKRLVGGLGKLTCRLNFSLDGQVLTGIFDERLFGAVEGLLKDVPPAHFGIIWHLDKIEGLHADEFKNDFPWTCKEKYQDRYPSHRGAYYAMSMEDFRNTLIVHTYERESGKRYQMPLRVLSEESQINAIRLHSLVKVDQATNYDPRKLLADGHGGNPPVHLHERVYFQGEPVVAWSKQFGDNSGYRSLARALMVDSQKNVIVVAVYSGTNFIQKYDPEGNLLWELDMKEVYGEKISRIIIRDLKIDVDDTIYYAGEVSPEGTSKNIAVGSISKNGTLLTKYWHKVPTKNYANALLYQEGEYTIAGYFDDGYRKKKPDKPPSKKKKERSLRNSQRYQRPEPNSGFFIAKMNDDFKFVRKLDDDHDSMGTPHAFRDKSGFTKKLTDIEAFSNGDLALIGLAVVHRKQPFNYLQRRKNSFGLRWAKRIAWTGKAVELPKICVDKEDNIYLSLPLHILHDYPNRPINRKYFETPPEKDVFGSVIRKYDGKGDMLWETLLKTDAKNDTASGLAVAPDGTLLVGLRHNKRPQLVRLAPDGTVKNGPLPVYSAEIANEGTIHAIAAVDDGTFYLAGEIRGPLVDGRVEKDNRPKSPYSGYGGGDFFAFVMKLEW